MFWFPTEVPVFLEGWDLPNTNATEGDDVQMKCKARGDPEPTVTWYINGEPIDGKWVTKSLL